MAVDPYAAPKSRVADTPADSPDGVFIPCGNSVAAGNGSKWIADAWELFKGQKGAWIGIALIFLVVIFVLSFIPFIGPLALNLISPILIGGVMLGCEAVRRGEPMTVGFLLAGFSKNAGRLAGVGAFMILAYIAMFAILALFFGTAIVGLFTGGMNNDPAGIAAMGLTIMLAGLVMLALSIPLYMAVWFSYPLIVLNDFTVGQALKASFSVCLKNMMPFLVYGIVALLLAVVASIPLGLGWLLLGPVLLASIYTGYRDIFYEP
jgi:uncharacterized membrane protein